jgi:predicted nucleotidyltransferase
VQKEEILDYLKSHKDYYLDNFGVKFIGLFGSFAKDQADENSDIDILYMIEKEKKLSLFKYLQLHKHLEELFQRDVDLVRDEKLKSSIRDSIETDIAYV